MQLVKYEQARQALAVAKNIDEAKDILDKAEALKAYAAQAQDKDLETWAAEIKLRAQRRVGEISSELEKSPGPGRGKTIPSGGKSFKGETLKQAGLSTSTANRYEQLAKIPDQEFNDEIEKVKERGQVPHSTQFVRQLSAKRKQKEVAEKFDHITPNMPDQKYPVIYADPPWKYEHAISSSRAIENHYPTMELEEIKALEVPKGDPCILYLWTTNPHLEQALQVMSAWGFSYRTNIAWVKPSIGPGYYARSRHELLLIGTYGDAIIPIEKPDSVIESARGAHSQKPEIFYNLIERAHPELPKIELFARSQRENWAAWGNQAA